MLLPTYLPTSNPSMTLAQKTEHVANEKFLFFIGRNEQELKVEIVFVPVLSWVFRSPAQ